MVEVNDNDYKIEILPKNFSKNDLLFKLNIFGDSDGGISDILNIINKLDKLEFLYNRTIGADFTTFNLKINNTAIRLIIFDTRGLEGYKTFITSFCRNVSLGIFVYAINSRYSFERINLWVKELKKVKINLKKF